jgi:NitT/TauT family transport system permease protein
VFYAILAMLVVILAYDQLLFRPLVAWSAKFRFETTQEDQGDDPWMLACCAAPAAAWADRQQVGDASSFISGLRLFVAAPHGARAAIPSRAVDMLWRAAGDLVAWAIQKSCIFPLRPARLTWRDLGIAFTWAAYTCCAVVLIALASADLGADRRLARAAPGLGAARAARGAIPRRLSGQPAVPGVRRVHRALPSEPDIWLTPLIILGTQWYILFNVIAGASAFPGDLLEAANNFRVGGCCGGAASSCPAFSPISSPARITASGGAWNAAIVAEVVTWGHTTLKAHGLGAYIAGRHHRRRHAARAAGRGGDGRFVLVFNRLVWRPMYAYSSKRLERLKLVRKASLFFGSKKLLLAGAAPK